ncbi:hypothetical protein, membrane or secreted, partial [gut metagenome]
LIATLGGSIAPVLAIGTAIAGLVGAFATLWNTNEEFRNSILDIWNEIQETVGGFCDGLVQRLNELGFGFESISEVISTAWQGLCEFLAPVFVGAMELIQEAFQLFSDVFFGIWDTLKGLFSGDWEEFWTGISEILVAYGKPLGK